ncbi:MAG: M28 family peptidase [Ferruginibacter sp.]
MKRKKITWFILSALILLLLIFIFQNYPISSPPKNFTALSDTAHIRQSLALITGTPLPRQYKNTEVLDTVAGRIEQDFKHYSNNVYRQTYNAKGRTYHNIIASFGPQTAERIIVGAHYDVCGNQEGADDNASGVAGIMELARLLKDSLLQYRIDLVAYTLEEPPFFNTNEMGSYIHAKSLYDSGIKVKGMVSLEMIGYFSDTAGSQDYPLFPLKWIYGDTGNYITVVQKSLCGDFAKAFKKYSFENNSILTKSFRTPSFAGGVNLSDHKNYWRFGYSAVMITNTAFFRNHNYHQTGDRITTLDIAKMARVIDGVFRTLMQY